MPRVLFVTQTHNVWGGMEQWLHRFTAWLQAQPGWEVRLALPQGAKFNDAKAYLRAHPHLDPVVLDVRVGSEESRVGSLTRAIVATAADIVIPIASAAVFAAIERARRRGAAARLLVPVRSLHPDLFCNLIDRAGVVDQIVGVSRLIEALLVELLPTERDRIRYVRHGVAPARRERVASSGPLRIGFVGRLEESTKRVLDLIPLIGELQRGKVAFELHVYGGGPDEARLRTALAERVPGAPITFHGVFDQERLYEEVYPEMDVLLLFSPAEGSPNAVYEAMQHGVVPVIARYLGQTGEAIVRDQQTGLTFAVGDSAAAAMAVALLATDRDGLAALSAAARREVENDSAERMHRDWERIFRAMLERPPKPLPMTQPRAAKAGRLDRLVPASLADALRRVLGRRFPHPDGWSEWPGTEPASPQCVARIERRLRELDADARRGESG